MAVLTELSRVMDSVCKDKGINRDEIVTAVEEAVLSAAQKLYRMQDIDKELEVHFNDEDGDVELMVKFSRPVLISMLSPGEAVVLTLTGTATGEPFSGEDTVRVIWNGEGFCPTQCVTNTFSLEATALKSAYSLTYSIDDLPEGASLNPLTGELTWTPPDGIAPLGVDPIAVTVSGEGFSITEWVPIAVMEHDLR